MLRSSTLVALAHSLCFYLLIANPSQAQIIPDNTLPNNSAVTTQGNLNVINGGTVAGNNLFHSFREFSLSNGEIAAFNNSLNIQNILTRVTGNSVSNINGLLQAQGSSNLFLINPNGIIFGRNAALNIGGSFIASTASSIRFGDGSEFSAINTLNTSQLSINVPLGLQFPGIPANIINRAANLEVSPGRTIGLLGGNITLENSQLTANQGRIELGSVGGDSLVSLAPTSNGWILGYDGVNNFGNIQLLSQSIANTSGGGNIQVQGGQVTLTDSSQIIAAALGNQNGGEIFLRANGLAVTNGSAISVQTTSTGNAGRINIQARTVLISGVSSDDRTFSTITATSRGSGNSGSINISSDRLTARDGGDISVTTFNGGRGGNLTVNAAQSIELIGARTSPDGQNFSRSGLFAATEGTQSGGDIRITTPKLQVRDGARVSVSTRGAGENGTPGGRGGNLSINADEIELIGNSPDGRFISGLFALSGEERPNIPNPSIATGDGGDIAITTKQLTITNGAQVSAATLGAGNGGNITVKADAIDITGASPTTQQFSTITATSRRSGSSGNITVDTRQLRVSQGADISATAFGTGNSGDLNINATASVELIGTGRIPNSTIFSRSGLFAATEGTQNGGDIRITTPTLQVRDGARVSVSTRGAGQNGTPGGRGGNLIINANNIELIGASADGQFISGLFALSGEERPNISNPSIATGQGGDIEITTEKLSINNGAQVSAASLGAGNSGNITVKADTIEITGASIAARQFSSLAATSRGTGNSGNVTINTKQLRTSDGADISVTAFGAGRSGNLNVNASDSIELIGASAIPNSTIFSRSGLFAATEGTQDGGSLTVNTGRLVVRDGARISVSTRGRGANGIPGGRGGNLTVNATGEIDLSGVGVVQLVRNGQIEINTFPSGLFALSGEPRPTIAENEATGIGGNLEITTGSLNIRNGAQVSVSARGSAPAGNLQAQARTIRLQDGSIIGVTVVGNGANITLQVDGTLQLRGNSQISTTAGTDGNGGNIIINADAIAILENSTISSDAGQQGGNIQITTQGLFTRPGAITASSARGTQFSGNVIINTPDVQPSQGLVDLPTFLAPENQVAQACTAEIGQNRNQFTITGRGGLPPSPTEPLSSETVRISPSTVSLPTNSPTTPQLPRPATGLAINPQGQVILTANTGEFMGQNLLPTANCHAFAQ